MRNGLRRGRVTSVGKNAAWVVPDDETIPIVAALPKSAVRLHLVPGDVVATRDLDDGRLLVEYMEPRTSVIERQTRGGRHKVMGANIDTLAIVAAFDRPPLHVEMVDELLAFAELRGVSALLALTKPDLVSAAAIERVRALYERIGYTVFIVNAKTGDGAAELGAALTDRHAFFIGQSGVGKSSLFRRFGGEGVVGDVSDAGRGRQTTTSARLVRLGSGFVIDSPGVGAFALDALEPGELARGFREFAEPSSRCRFTDCRHRGEPGCAIAAAVDAGTIAVSRYASYRAIEDREER